MIACENCSEAKILTSSLAVSETRTNNAVKEKILLAITTVMKKLGLKLQTFKDIESIIKLYGKSLTESAEEVRNEAKNGLICMKEQIETRDLNNLFKRCLNDREIAKIEEFLNKSQSGDRFMITNTRTKAKFSLKSATRSKTIRKANLEEMNDESLDLPIQSSSQSKKRATKSSGFAVVDMMTL